MAAAEARHRSNKSNRNKSSMTKTKNGKNPYADLGREGFCALLEELEEKKQKILSQVGSEDVSVIRFVHSDDKQLKPVVVVAKGNKDHKVKLLTYDDGPTAVAADGTEPREAMHAADLVPDQRDTAVITALQDKWLAAEAPEEPSSGKPSDEQDKQLVATGPAAAEGSSSYPPAIPQTSQPRPPHVLNMSNNFSKNPYSNLGLEKFSALLEKLEEKKRDIISQMGPDEVPLVHFTHSGENRLKPIVVTPKGKKDMQLVTSGSAPATKNVKQAPTAPSAVPEHPQVFRARSKNGKNPYADLGLEKFSALLEEIEEKKQQIISQINQEEAPLIRFSYSGDNDLKPIVVSTKGKKDRQLVTARSAPTEENSKQLRSSIPTSSATVSATTSAAASLAPSAAASLAPSAAASPSPSTGASPGRSTAALPPQALRSSNKNSKNPYADLGREKFTALLKELEEKKQEIISQVSPEEVPLVRFSYSGDNNLKPILVTGKGKKKDRQLVAAEPASTSSSEAPPLSPSAAAQAAIQVLRTSDRNSKNPYSKLGLDKFSVLLEELEEKKKQILSQIGPEDLSLLRFSYSGNNELKPIVVTAKGKKDGKEKRYGFNGGHVAASETQEQSEEQTAESEANEEAIANSATEKENDTEENPAAAVATEESNQTLAMVAANGFEDSEHCNVNRAR